MILMNAFKAEPPELKASLLAAAGRVIESGHYILGNEVLNFEHQWAKICGITHAVGVGNGMDAIEIALRALGIGKGDEVITTAMTAFATVLAIIRSGATPVLADVEPGTALMSVESVRRCISTNTRAIVLVHLYGQMRDMDAWQNLCAEKNLSLVEDCAQAHLSSWREGMSGSFGSAGAFSFYPTKNLGALGDAGMLVTQDLSVAQAARSLRNYGQSNRYHHEELGLNSRLDELQAAFLTERLKWLSKFNEQRRKTAKTYRAGIKNALVKHLQEPQETCSHTHHLFVVICKQRDALQQYLFSNGVQSLSHYPVPIHKQSPFLEIARDPEGLVSSENHAATCLSLPCHPQLSDGDVNHVIQVINNFNGCK